MKNYLMVALILCAIPAVAVGQTVSCDDCSHVASVYMGEGGFIATADDADMVTWVATCNGVTRSGELEADDDGTVAALWAGDLACHGDAKSDFQIGPVMDGGWFWITDADNSAVGGLVAKDVLDNDAADITSAGEGVTMTAGKGAVFMKETSTGRVGILPNILPEPPADPAAICGPRMVSAFPNAYGRQATSNCMLGGGRTKIRLIGPGAHGSRSMITNGMVYRPSGGTITVTADLWVDESGSYSTNADSTSPTYVADIQKGWPGKTATATSSGRGENWLTATFGLQVAQAVGQAPPLALNTPTGGVTLTNIGDTSTTSGRTGGDAPVGQAVFTIGGDSSYCSSSNNHTATINIFATPAAPGATPGNSIHPPVATGEDAGLGRSSAVASFAAITQLRVVCPPSSSAANQGQELVPENPFPISE